MSAVNAQTKYDEGRLMQVLVAPIVSEKATMIAEKSNSVTFKVLQDATKYEIKAAVELMFKVDVKAVAVLNIKGKTKRFGKSVGRRDNIRKAYVTLKPGQELNLGGETRAHPLNVYLVGVPALLFEEDLMALLFGEPNHFVLDRRAVTRADAFDKAAVHRRSV